MCVCVCSCVCVEGVPHNRVLINDARTRTHTHTYTHTHVHITGSLEAKTRPRRCFVSSICLLCIFYLSALYLLSICFVSSIYLLCIFYLSALYLLSITNHRYITYFSLCIYVLLCLVCITCIYLHFHCLRV